MSMARLAHRGVPLQLQGLSKRFGSVQALRALDLDIQTGELVAFLGPSGCGKTTTLLLIAGIYRASEGAIFFGDERIDALHPRHRDVGMVFQSYALYPHLSLFENIAFPLRLKRTPRTEIDQRVKQAAELLGIDEQLARRPSQVSGGQQQRAALARALVKEPRVLLLDEPLSNLDAQIRLHARGEIRRLQQELGITSVLVTHDQSEALAMADRVAVFREGQLLQYASSEELYDRPADTFVAQFVGHPPMNVLAGSVENGAFVGDGFSTPVPHGCPPGTVLLGIRPEDARVGGSLEARISVIEPLGREFLVTCRLGEAIVQVLSTERPEPDSAGMVTLGFPVERLHIFDADGRRIAT